MLKVLFIFFLFCSIELLGQKIDVLVNESIKNAIEVCYWPKDSMAPEQLYLKYYISKDDKKIIPFKKNNGKYETIIQTNGLPSAIFFTIDFSPLTKYDDNFKKAYSYLINVKNHTDSLQATILKVKNSRNCIYFLNIPPQGFEDYFNEINILKSKISVKEFEVFKLDYLNFLHRTNPEKYKIEILQYLSSLSSNQDEDLEGYICAVYRNILGDSAFVECEKKLKLKIPDSEINASEFTNSFENSITKLDKSFIYSKLEEFQKLFPNHLDLASNIYNPYLEVQIRNQNLKEIEELISTITFDKITFAYSISKYSKNELLKLNHFSLEEKAFFNKVTDKTISLIDTINLSHDLYPKYFYKRLSNIYQNFALIFFEVNKKNDAFRMIEKSYFLEPFEAEVINALVRYSKEANGELFTKEYLENSSKLFGTSAYQQLQINQLKGNLISTKSEIERKERVITIDEKEISKTFENLKAPNFKLLNLDNQLAELKEFKGKRVVLYFWATWCSPCISSMPYLHSIMIKNPNVKFLLIDTWENNNKDIYNKVISIVNEKKLKFDVLFDLNNKAANAYKLESIPSKFLIDERGNIELINPSLKDLEEYLSLN